MNLLHFKVVHIDEVDPRSRAIQGTSQVECGRTRGARFRCSLDSNKAFNRLSLRNIYVTAFKGIQGIPVIPKATRDFAKSLWWPGNTRNH